MNKDNIISLPNAQLRQRSQKVGLITPEIRQLIADMKIATLDWEDSRQHEVGVALAAIQVDALLRVIVIRNDFDDKNNREFTVFINPVIAKYFGKVEDDFEGCLSVRDIYGKIPRYTKIKVDAMDENGQPFRVVAEGFLARTFQHEIDHTNGILIIDHIKDKPNAFYKLNDNGKLEPLDYEKNVRDNPVLW